MPVEIAHVVLPLIVAISIVLMLARPRGIPEVWWISGGVLLLLALRLLPLRLAGHAVARGSDVYLFLTGMMLLSELAREQGVFDWVAAAAVRGAKGSGSRLFLLVYGVGALVTVFMSNDATAVVLTPAILTAVRKAKVSPLPCLFACALIANAASFVLPISNPANLVVFHTGMPPLERWLADFGVPSLLSILVTFAVLRILFRHELCDAIESQVEDVTLSGSGKLVLIGLALMIAVLLAASAMRKDLGLPTCLAALGITAVVSIRSKINPIKLAREISWATLLLVAGLFVMVEAVESQGALRLAQQWLAWASCLGQSTGAMIVGFVVGIANNIVNNLPLGLIAGGTIQAAHTKGLLAHAVLIGVDLGPNLSVTGSLATILWLLAIRRESDAGGGKIDVSFWKFLKVGAIAMPAALFAALGGAILMQSLVGQHEPRKERRPERSFLNTPQNTASLPRTGIPAYRLPQTMLHQKQPETPSR
jgi:arsenical pump membrane protein